MTQEKIYKKPNGSAAAAMLSAMIGILSMTISNIVSEALTSTNIFLQQMGSAWIPSANAIGPYSGKETIMLVTWGVSWLVLYMALKRKEVNLSHCAIIFMAGISIATFLVWNPFIHVFVK
ncbi:MAG: hypothetical protein ACREA3_05585 [Nitrosotalea sp.]